MARAPLDTEEEHRPPHRTHPVTYLGKTEAPPPPTMHPPTSDTHQRHARHITQNKTTIPRKRTHRSLKHQRTNIPPLWPWPHIQMDRHQPGTLGKENQHNVRPRNPPRRHLCPTNRITIRPLPPPHLLKTDRRPDSPSRCRHHYQQGTNDPYRSINHGAHPRTSTSCHHKMA